LILGERGEALTQFLDVPVQGDEYHVAETGDAVRGARSLILAYSAGRDYCRAYDTNSESPAMPRKSTESFAPAHHGCPGQHLFLRPARLRRAVLLERVLNVRAGGPIYLALIAGLFALPTFAYHTFAVFIEEEKAWAAVAAIVLGAAQH